MIRWVAANGGATVTVLSIYSGANQLVSTCASAPVTSGTSWENPINHYGFTWLADTAQRKPNPAICTFG